jgi:phosphoribosylaminoimidazole-succinocarboxamide synthase
MEARMTSKKKKKIYEGKAKILYETSNPDQLVQEFKDDATAFNGAKKGKIKNKGVINNKITAQLFRYLESYNVPTHFIAESGEDEMLIRKLQMIPLEVVVRNIASGSLVKRGGQKEGQILDKPLIEFYLKDDAKNDPMIDETYILSNGLATSEDLRIISRMAGKVNALLKSFFMRRALKLVDFKLEFGRARNKIFLADEISPDTCRLWDVKTDKKMDKDRFRQDLGGIEEAYEEVLRRVLRMNDAKEG